MKLYLIINHSSPFHLHWKLQIQSKKKVIVWAGKEILIQSTYLISQADYWGSEVYYSCIVLSYGFLDKLIDPKWLLHHVTGTSLLLFKAINFFFGKIAFHYFLKSGDKSSGIPIF